MLLKRLFSFILLSNLYTLVPAFTVKTEDGLLSGTSYVTVEGKEVIAFLGVPYARPPTGQFRFVEPQPVTKWAGVRQVHSFSPKCIQFTYYNLHSDPIVGEEDCLYLNIFTPSITQNKKFHVIFYIHGGAFMFGGGDMFLPDYILNRHDLVFVSINYRLGPFGFLTTEDGIIPGNIGLKDQVHALKWVQNNIEHFGGDKNKVTIAGLSAGGASVHLHYLSPLSQNLFHKGISLSGSAFCPWVIAERSYEKAAILASSVGCPTESSKQILECLRFTTAKELLAQTQSLFMPWHFNPFSPFGVVVENPGDSAFLSKNPYRLLKEGNVQDVPWLTSVTTEEGLYPGAYFINNNVLLQNLDENWNQIAPHILDYNHTIPSEQLAHVREMIRNNYLGEKKVSKESVKELVKVIGDRLFIADVERAARLQAAVMTSPVYFYRFGYRGTYSLSDMLCECTDNFGSSHGDDLMHLLKSSFQMNPFETKSDKEMMELMVNMWTSFVRTGRPSLGSNIDWPPVSRKIADGGNLTYLLVSSSKEIHQLSSEDLANRKFWNSLPFEELWNSASVKSDRYVDEL